jgi:hypothetical protein
VPPCPAMLIHLRPAAYTYTSQGAKCLNGVVSVLVERPKCACRVHTASVKMGWMYECLGSRRHSQLIFKFQVLIGLLSDKQPGQS